MSSSEEESVEEDSDGFKDKHKCTDCACTVLFLASLAALIGIMIWSFVAGDTRKLSRGLDVNGQLCGLSEGVVDRPVLYYCPKQLIVSLRTLVIDKEFPVCLPSCPTGTVDMLTNTTHVLPATVPECPPAVSQAYSAVSIRNIYCLPETYYSSKALREVDEAVSDSFSSIGAGVQGTLSSWPVLLFTIVVATVLGYIYLWILRVTAKFLIWLCVFASVALLIGLGCYLWVKEDLFSPLPSSETAAELADSTATAGDGSDGHTDLRWLQQVVAVVLWVLAGAVACLACCCGSSVELSMACIQTAAVVIWKMPLMLLSPLIKALAKCFVFLLLFYGWMHLWATGEVTGKGLHRNTTHTQEQWCLMLFYVYVSYWVLGYLSALYQFSVAYAVAKYYQTSRGYQTPTAQEEDDIDGEIDSLAVIEGTIVGVVKHTGSLAYGAAIIAFLELLQSIIAYVKRKNDEMGEEANKCIRCMLQSCLCCCRCFEGVVQFFNKNAYIDIAVTGENNFCEAARNVMHVVIDFGPAMAILNGATQIMQIVGMAAITVICGFLAFVLLKFYGSDMDVGNPAIAIGVASFIAFTVAWAFMAIFDVTTDTLLYCYADDKQEHGGRAAYAPEDMRDLYEKADEEAKARQAKKAQQQEKQLRAQARSRR